MSTLSSPGIENAAVRDAADAMSSRAISIICVGMFKRSRPPSASAHRLTARSPAGGGLLNVSAYRVALIDALRRLDALGRRGHDAHRDLRLRRDIRAQLRAGGLALQAPRQRRVRAEERVRQHDGIRRHGIDLRLRRSLHRDDVRRLLAVERRLQRDVLAANDAVDEQRFRTPLQVVIDLGDARRDVDRRAEAARAAHDPAIGQLAARALPRGRPAASGRRRGIVSRFSVTGSGGGVWAAEGAENTRATESAENTARARTRSKARKRRTTWVTIQLRTCFPSTATRR